MGDVSVSASGVSSGAEAESDLQLIYTGGENFLARMKALSDSRAVHEKAFLDLKIGRDAKAAFDEAKQKNTAADADRISAAALLGQAKDEAERIIANASAQARIGTEKADNILSAKTAEAGAIVSDAQERAKKLRSEAEAGKQAAVLARTQAERNASDAKNALDAHKAAESAANAKQVEADKRHVLLTKKIDALHRAIEDAKNVV